MITREQLLEAGFEPFSHPNLKDYTTSFFQKHYNDVLGKKYFITIAEYDNRKYQHNAPNMPDFSYGTESHFTISGEAFRVEMVSPKSVEAMEEFFSNVWSRMCCDYYRKWD